MPWIGRIPAFIGTLQAASFSPIGALVWMSMIWKWARLNDVDVEVRKLTPTYAGFSYFQASNQTSRKCSVSRSARCTKPIREVLPLPQVPKSPMTSGPCRLRVADDVEERLGIRPEVERVLLRPSVVQQCWTPSRLLRSHFSRLIHRFFTLSIR